MDNDAIQRAILNGIAEGMERDADRITKEGQQIRDAIQPLGRIVPENEQKWLNTITVSLHENVRNLRELAALLRKLE